MGNLEIFNEESPVTALKIGITREDGSPVAFEEVTVIGGSKLSIPLPPGNYIVTGRFQAPPGMVWNPPPPESRVVEICSDSNTPLRFRGRVS